MNQSLTPQIQEPLRKLVELFHVNIDQYKGANYDEANTRTDFIDKFFELLGWDVRNTAGYSEQYRDVIREDRIKIDNRPKAPDYAFKIGKERKFFVEAKKPSVNIHEANEPAFQVRRYGYSAKLALSILTDFEELAVYDTRIKPHHTDKASVARIFYGKYTEYLEKFDFLYNTFSKEAILRGSFDRYIQENKNKKGTSEVDTELLALVEDWRLTLAKNIAKQNPELDSYHLNTAVQRIVDRILFLRIAEDRRIERYEDLLDVAQKPDIYAGLQHLFVAADEKYNAGLFLRESWLSKIAVDDKVLSPIVKGLYYPCPYAFSEIPIEILGNIYERFLGKTIVLSPNHVAKVEEKPEVRKAGGVYYTPQYIVDYIVAETVGRKLETSGTQPSRLHKGKNAGETPAFQSKLPTILDSACGSGSFLVGAYTFLLDHFLSSYTDDKNLKKSLKTGLIYESHKDTFRLSIEEKQRILLQSIYGVDIDPIAVEVTKLSLYLKLLENETEESAGLLFKHSDLKMLPNLDKNIRCGNSLIGSDYYRNKEMPLFGDEEIRRVNAFDWEKEFPQVFLRKSERPTGAEKRSAKHTASPATGFDCVIGNPPYVRIQTMKHSDPEQVVYYKEKYRAAAEGNYDLYTLFIEKGLSLLNPDGRLGIICPNKFFTAQYGRPIRHLLTTGSHISHIANFGVNQVFDNATTYTALLFLDNQPRKIINYSEVIDISSWKVKHNLTLRTRKEVLAGKREPQKTVSLRSVEDAEKTAVIPTESLGAAEWNFCIGEKATLFEKLSQMPVKLGDVAKRIFQGIVTSVDAIYLLESVGKNRGNKIPIFSSHTGKQYLLEKAVLKPLCKGARDVRRYSAVPSRYVLFPYDIAQSAATGTNTLLTPELLKQKYPNTWAYLLENKKHLRGREKGKMKHAGWYGYVYPKNITLFEQPKILTPSIASRAAFTFDAKGEFYFVGSGGGGGGGSGITLHEQYGLAYEYVTALLNSRLLDWFLKQISSPFRGGYYAYNRQYIEKLPIVIPVDKKQKVRHDKLVSLVDQMLSAQERLRNAKFDADRKTCTERIEILDRQIDTIVYELYGLTDEEIGMVENV